MNKELYRDAQQIITHAIRQVLSETAVADGLALPAPMSMMWRWRWQTDEINSKIFG